MTLIYNTSMKTTKTQIIDKRLGQNISRIRKANGLSQQDMEKYYGISRAYLGKAEKGEHSLSVDKLADIANAFGILITDLFFDENGEPIG